MVTKAHILSSFHRLPRVKASKKMENRIMKKFAYSYNEVNGGEAVGLGLGGRKKPKLTHG